MDGDSTGLLYARGTSGQGVGTEERNMDPTKRFDKRLLWYQVAMWTCVAMWPPTLVFALWQILAVGHLAIWEVLVMAVVLGNVATIILVVGTKSSTSALFGNAAWASSYWARLAARSTHRSMSMCITR